MTEGTPTLPHGYRDQKALPGAQLLLVGLAEPFPAAFTPRGAPRGGQATAKTGAKPPPTRTMGPSRPLWAVPKPSKVNSKIRLKGFDRGRERLSGATMRIPTIAAGDSD